MPSIVVFQDALGVRHVYEDDEEARRAMAARPIAFAASVHEFHRAAPPLAWTTEPAKVAGWYWIEGSAGRRLTVVWLLLGQRLCGCRIAGPIPEPQEPTP